MKRNPALVEELNCILTAIEACDRREMLRCIDELLAAMGKPGTVAEPLRAAMLQLEGAKQVQRVAADRECAAEPPDSAPSFWHM